MAKKEKYEGLAKSIMGFVGGKDNISFFTHCVTRLRFNLKDKDLANIKEIEAINSVIGVQWSGEQLQLIIGADVADAYKIICKENQLNEEKSLEENLDQSLAKKKRFSVGAMIDGISGCITPVLPMLIASGMFKVILALLTQFGIMPSDAPTYVVLSFVSDAPFYFLPVAVGVTGAKKFGADVSLGIMLGAALLHPTFMSLVSEGTKLSVFGLPILGKTYSNSVFPMILTMYICGHVERFIAKRSPKVLRSILEPLLTLLVMTPLMLCLIAPLGTFLSTYLTAAIMWIYNMIGPLGIAIIAALFPLLVMTGMHTALIPFVTERFATIGYEPFIGVPQCISNLNQGVAGLAVALKTKDTNLKFLAVTSGIAALLSGTTEPVLFGVNLRYKTPLIAVMIGNFCGALYAGINSVVRYSYGGNSILSLAVFFGENKMNFPNMIISIVIGMTVTFIATLILYKPNKD